MRYSTCKVLWGALGIEEKRQSFSFVESGCFCLRLRNHSPISNISCLWTSLVPNSWRDGLVCKELTAQVWGLWIPTTLAKVACNRSRSCNLSAPKERWEENRDALQVHSQKAWNTTWTNNKKKPASKKVEREGQPLSSIYPLWHATMFTHMQANMHPSSLTIAHKHTHTSSSSLSSSLSSSSTLSLYASQI